MKADDYQDELVDYFRALIERVEFMERRAAEGGSLTWRERELTSLRWALDELDQRYPGVRADAQRMHDRRAQRPLGRFRRSGGEW